MVLVTFTTVQFKRGENRIISPKASRQKKRSTLKYPKIKKKHDGTVTMVMPPAGNHPDLHYKCCYKACF
jgi:hypothetical protein